MTDSRQRAWRWASVSGWQRWPTGSYPWFVQGRDGTRRVGVAKTQRGAKSAITQVKRRVDRAQP